MQFNSADRYPPVMNQAALLAERLDVVLLDTGPHDPAPPAVPGLRRSRVTWAPSSRPWRFSRLSARAVFAVRARRLAATVSAAVVAYEPDAIACMLTGAQGRHKLTVAHLHEHPSPGVYDSTTDRIALGYVRRRIGAADVLVVADARRGQLLRERWGLAAAPLVVRNCPRRLDSVPEPRLAGVLSEHGLGAGQVVYYQGSIGAHAGLEDLVSTMPSWPLRSLFVLAGRVTREFRGTLETCAAAVGVAGRLCFLGQIPYRELFGLAAGANVGVSLLNPASEQWRLAAGASNKRFEYAALGLPQVTTAAPGIEETFVSRGMALAVPWGDRAALAAAINRLLRDPELRRRMGERARATHLSEYNYEGEFAPVLEMICRGAEEGSH